MKKTILSAVALLLTSPALGADVNGNSALSLAALIGLQSPALTAAEKNLLNAYLDGQPKANYPADKTVAVKAEEVTCRISNVDLTAKSCDLKFGTHPVSLAGRQAHELYATLIEAGVPPSGAAGSIVAGLKTLLCTVDPQEVKQEGGGGARCTFETNQ
jgi:hypothetical protein